MTNCNAAAKCSRDSEIYTHTLTYSCCDRDRVSSIKFVFVVDFPVVHFSTEEVRKKDDGFAVLMIHHACRKKCLLFR
jgi:hypothetical protein